jgi:hypothetical protein
MKNTKLMLPLALITLTLFVAGCASDGAANATKPQPTANVEMFRDGQKPTRPYKEIALLTDDGGIKEQGEIEAKFVKRAKTLGANALILQDPVKSGGEANALGFGFGWHDTYYYKASAVVYE